MNKPLYLDKQCAAVSTIFSDTRVPPQNQTIVPFWSFSPIAAMYGTLFWSLTGLPPIILGSRVRGLSSQPSES